MINDYIIIVSLLGAFAMGIILGYHIERDDDRPYCVRDAMEMMLMNKEQAYKYCDVVLK